MTTYKTFAWVMPVHRATPYASLYVEHTVAVDCSKTPDVAHAVQVHHLTPEQQGKTLIEYAEMFPYVPPQEKKPAKKVKTNG